MAFGFVALVVWQIIEVVAGHRGSKGAKRAFKQGTSVVKAGIYAFFAYGSWKVATQGSGGKDSTEPLVAKVLGLPAGQLLVGLAGAAVALWAGSLIRSGITATTAMNGAKAPIDKTDWSPLAGKAVLIWPDRDAPGWDYAEAAARACVSAGAVSVAILEPPTDRPTGWDVADAVEEACDVQAFRDTGERRERLADPVRVLPGHLHQDADHAPISLAERDARRHAGQFSQPLRGVGRRLLDLLLVLLRLLAGELGEVQVAARDRRQRLAVELGEVADQPLVTRSASSSTSTPFAVSRSIYGLVRAAATLPPIR